MITKKGSTKIVNFMTPDDGGLMLRCSSISRYREYALSSTLSICSTLIAIVLRVYIILLSMQLLIFIYLMMGLVICRFSDNRVTVKTCEPLVKQDVICWIFTNVVQNFQVSNYRQEFIFYIEIVAFDL